MISFNTSKINSLTFENNFMTFKSKRRDRRGGKKVTFQNQKNDKGSKLKNIELQQ